MKPPPMHPAVRGYLEAALFSSFAWWAPTGDVYLQKYAPLDSMYSVSDFTAAAVAKRAQVVHAFTQAYQAEIDRLGLDPDEIGRNLFWSRERHGSGFWDARNRWKQADPAQATEDMEALHAAAVALGSDTLGPEDFRS